MVKGTKVYQILRKQVFKINTKNLNSERKRFNKPISGICRRESNSNVTWVRQIIENFIQWFKVWTESSCHYCLWKVLSFLLT